MKENHQTQAIGEEQQKRPDKLHTNSRRRLTRVKEAVFENLFLFCACASILSVAVITVYIFWKGGPAIAEIGVGKFLLGMVWMPQANEFGIFPMIIASILGTAGAVLIGVIVGIFVAVFLAEAAPPWLARLVRPAIELLAGIPSVVYGFFGLIVIIPLIDKYFGGGGNSLLAVIIILAIMILPTIISISETSMRAVPAVYKEGSLALGASHIQTIFKVIIPAAKSGILASVVLGTGRAIGETMAVILVAGNTPQIPNSILDRVRTLTANIALEMNYAQGLHERSLFATGAVLFVFILLLNIVLNTLIYRKAAR